MLDRVPQVTIDNLNYVYAAEVASHLTELTRVYRRLSMVLKKLQKHNQSLPAAQLLTVLLTVRHLGRTDLFDLLVPLEQVNHDCLEAAQGSLQMYILVGLLTTIAVDLSHYVNDE